MKANQDPSHRLQILEAHDELWRQFNLERPFWLAEMTEEDRLVLMKDLATGSRQPSVDLLDVTLAVQA
jgi:hypothetical protein